MFEYKVRCRHKLGWKEFKLYADTDIEEFFNRNSIDYVRNITDTVENRQLQENKRLNNIMNRIDSFVDRTVEIIKQQPTGDDEWILERLNGIKYLIELKENNND